MGGGGKSDPVHTTTEIERKPEEESSAIEENNRQMLEYMRQQQEMWASYLEKEKQRREQARQEEIERQKEIARGQAYDDIDAYYEARIEAEEVAVDSVLQEMENERSQASLYGIEYQGDETDKEKRIQERFEELWSSADEQHLANLIGQYGAPEMDYDRRLAIEEGGISYAWNPERKYTDFEYDEVEPPGGDAARRGTGGDRRRGEGPPGGPSTRERGGDLGGPDIEERKTGPGGTPGNVIGIRQGGRGRRAMSSTQSKLLGGVDEDLNTLLGGNDVLSLLG